MRPLGLRTSRVWNCSGLQEVGIWAWDNFCWFSLFPTLWAWGTVIFQLSGFIDHTWMLGRKGRWLSNGPYWTYYGFLWWLMGDTSWNYQVN